MNHPESLTHQHLVAVINTLLAEKPTRTVPVTILDLGCGNGHFIDFMLSTLPQLRPEACFEVYGLDVYDAGGEFNENMSRTRSYLQSKHPSLPWGERLKFVSTKDRWPFENRSFDFVISNQVMEHVKDHDLVFSEVRRTLNPNGASVHLFPLREVLWEGHVYMPLVHKALNYEKAVFLTYLFARMGFRKRWRIDRERYGWGSLREFSEDMAWVILSETNYLTYRQFLTVAKRQGLAISFSYSKKYVSAKLLSYLGKRPFLYGKGGALSNFLGFFFCKYVTSVTLMLRKVERETKALH